MGAYPVCTLTYAILSYPAGAVCDRRLRAVVASGLGSSPSAYLGLIHAPWLVFLELPLDEGFAACMDGVGKAWISELVPSHRLGTAQGLYQGASGAAILLAGLWAGLARQSDGRIPLLVSGTVALALAAALPAIVRTTGQPDE